MMGIWRRWKFLRNGEAEMQEELRSLQEMADGPELGNLTYAAEEARAMWRWTWLDNLWRDMRYAVRVLSRQRGFTAVTVLSLGLGIGANAAIYSLIDRVLWRQLPVREPERLFGIEYAGSYFAFQQYVEKSREMFEGVLATSGTEERQINTGGEDQRGRVELVSGNYFQLLGTLPAIGRTIAPEDDIRGQSEAVAVLSYRYWQQAFGGDPAILGRQVRVSKVPFTVIGIAQPEFFGISVGRAADMWLPLTKLHEVFPGRKWLDNRGTSFMDVVARLRPGISPERAATALTPLARSIEIERSGRDLPDWIRKKIEASQLRLIPASQGLSALRARFSKPLQVLFALVGIVLLLACVNVMGLQFARTDERRRELNVRLALGAGRGRVVRQLLTESLVVALAGGLLGLVLYRPAAAAVVSLVTMYGEPIQLPVQLDSGLLLFVLGLALAAAMVCGMVPALRATRPQPAAGLQQNTRSATAGPMRRALGRTVASVQMALSVVLMAGAFLFAFSLYRLTHYETGLDRRNLLVADVDIREAGYKQEQVGSLYLRILDRIKAMNRVDAVSFSGTGVYSRRNSNSQLLADGFQAEPGPGRNAYYDHVGPGYFTTLHTRILAGRDFDDRDIESVARIAIVSQAFAQHFFPGKDPVGLNIYRADDANKVPISVIGVVEDIRYDVRQPPRRSFYLPARRTESGMPSVRFVVRTQASESELRTIIRAEDAAARVTIDSANTLLDRTLDLDRLIAMLSLAFGVLAIILAAVGIYGLLAYEVTRRTGEIGIRMALGATQGRVLSMVFREVVYVGAAGMIVGITAAGALGKFVAALVFEMKPADPAVLVSAALLLGVVAAGAAWLPARRASRLDPMAALRHD